MSYRNNPHRRREWNPMRDDYNDNTYDVQYDDDNAGEKVELDHTKLYIINLPEGLTEEGIQTAFSRHGKLVTVRLSKNPAKRFAIVQYESASEAKLAMMKMNGAEPLNLRIYIAHKTVRQKPRHYYEKSNTAWNGNNRRDGGSSVSSKNFNTRNLDEESNCDEFNEIDDLITEDHNKNLDLELDMLTLKQLKIKEEQLLCKRRLLLHHAEKKQIAAHSLTTRSILPDGRIVVRNNTDGLDAAENDASFAAAGCESSETLCSCRTKTCDRASEGASSTSTCVVCTGPDKDKSLTRNKSDVKSYDSKMTMTEPSSQYEKCNCEVCDLESDGDDETIRLIQLRNIDYAGVVEEKLKIVVALAQYPRNRMRLRQMEIFQRCLNNIIELQVQNGLLREIPSFVDYYLNHGAIVVVCKDEETRDWIVRITPGLEERMNEKIIVLKSTVKRVYLAVMKIPHTCWPTTATDVFKLLQYFNPAIKTSLWNIYNQKVVDGVEITSLLLDRISGEVIRGFSFKNVIDYSQMDFELIGQREIYHEDLLSSLDDDFSSVSSRAKLLAEIKSGEQTPKSSEISLRSKGEKVINVIEPKESNKSYKLNVSDIKKDLECSLQQEVLDKLKDVLYVGQDNEIFIWSKEVSALEDDSNETFISDSSIVTSAALSFMSESPDIRDTLHVDTSKGKPYYRRTNYLHVETELKIAITLAGYPTDKLEAPHMKLLKQAFKDLVHKDAKMKKFGNLIQPHFHDVYLTNGASIYICNCIESRDYLLQILPKLILTTGLKLTVKDIKDLVRYTRVSFRLPKELAHVASKDILDGLKSFYSGLKIECWKHYSSVIGKQKREFGVDPDSLQIIKSPIFSPKFDGHTLEFRIIDRTQKYLKDDEMCQKKEDISEVERRAQEILKKMYNPINPLIKNFSLSKIRTDHYSNLIDDDLKLFLGPVDYPDNRIDVELFNTIKKTFQNIVLEAVEKDIMGTTDLPVFHDIYLFDGVIFVICQNLASRRWIENILSSVNSRLGINLKHTEYRGAVGIISMSVHTTKTPEKVIETLQIRNPRLRTKFWRLISFIQTITSLDIVLQIDKFSAQIITSDDFVGTVGKAKCQFKLGHLTALLKKKHSVDLATLATIEEKANNEVINTASKAKKNNKKNKKKKSANSGTGSKSTTETDDSNNHSRTDISERKENINKKPTQVLEVQKNVCNTTICTEAVKNITSSKKHNNLHTTNNLETTQVLEVQNNVCNTTISIEDAQNITSPKKHNDLDTVSKTSRTASSSNQEDVSKSTLPTENTTVEIQPKDDVTENASHEQVEPEVIKRIKKNKTFVKPDNIKTETRFFSKLKNSLDCSELFSIAETFQTECAHNKKTTFDTTNDRRHQARILNEKIREAQSNPKPVQGRTSKKLHKRFRIKAFDRVFDGDIAEYIHHVGSEVQIIDKETKVNNEDSNNTTQSESLSHDPTTDASTNKINEIISVETTDQVKDFDDDKIIECHQSENETQDLLLDNIEKETEVLSHDEYLDNNTIESVSEDNKETKPLKFEPVKETDQNENIIETNEQESPTLLVLRPETIALQKMLFKIPKDILPDEEDDVNLLFEVLKDKNPGLKPELWKIHPLSTYDKGSFFLQVDYESMKVITGPSFNSYVGGLQRIPSRQCVKCGAAADLYCSRCGVTPYCSQRCQRTDWPDRHRAVCHNLALLKADKLNEDVEPIPPQNAPLRRPHSPSRQNRDETDHNKPKMNQEYKQPTPKQLSYRAPNTSYNNVNGRHQDQRRPARVEPKQEENEEWDKKNIKPVEPPKQSSPPKTKDTHNPIAPVTFQRRQQNANPVVNVQNAVKNHQPAVKEQQPAVKEQQPVVKEQQPAVKEQQPVINANKPAAKDQLQAVKTVNKSVADVKTVVKEKLVPNRCLIETLSEGDSVLLSIEMKASDCNTKQDGYVCLSMHEKHENDYQKLCEDYVLDCEADPDDYKITIGETFSYLNPEDGGWYRARALNMTTAALIDGSKIIRLKTDDKVKKLSPKYASIMEFCCVLNATVEVGANLMCSLQKKTPNGFKVSLDDVETGNNVGDGEICRWLPVIEYPVPTKNTAAPQLEIPEIARPDVKNKSKVILVDATEIQRVFVRPADTAAQMAFDNILQEVLLYGTTAEPLKVPPTKGQIVVSKFSDNLHYRALCKRTSVNKNKYLLEYIEYGNVEITQLERLYPCPERLSVTSLPSMTSHVQLDVKVEELTPQALQYIQSIKEEEMILTLSNGVETSASGTALVTLTLVKNNENVNKKIEDFCTPEWKKLELKGVDIIEMERLMYSTALEYIELPEGPFTLQVLDEMALDSGNISGCPTNDDYVTYVMTKLPLRLKEYCESEFGRKPYLPSAEELCVAQFSDGEWRRAVVLQQLAGGDTASLLYVDHGNIAAAPVASLRKMLPEFIHELPAVACQITIEGFPEQLSKDKLEKAREFMKVENGHGEVLVKKCIKQCVGIYTIQVPELLRVIS